MKNIPYGHHWIDKVDIRSVVQVLKSDWLTQGPKIEEFENALGKYTGAKFAVAVSSGTAALHIAALAAGLKRGREAIVSPVTFVASANCIVYCGGSPVFADIEENTANIDSAGIEKKITKRTQAIIPVHFSGYPCDLKGIQRIARKHGLTVIEDAAHALGASYQGSKIGSCKYSDMTTFSFHPIKTMTTGEGGAVLTNNKKIHEKLLLLRSHGIEKSSSRFFTKRQGEWQYEMQELGFNYRLTDIQAGLGVSQLKKIDVFVSRRRGIAGIYAKRFRDNPYFDLPCEKQGIRSSFHLYPVRIKCEWAKRKAEVFSRLRDSGLGVQVHYIPVYAHPFYRRLGYRGSLCPKAEAFYHKEISLPIYPGMSDKVAQYVADTILREFKQVFG